MKFFSEPTDLNYRRHAEAETIKDLEERDKTSGRFPPCTPTMMIRDIELAALEETTSFTEWMNVYDEAVRARGGVLAVQAVGGVRGWEQMASGAFLERKQREWASKK